MATRRYDIAFVGGGLAAATLLAEMHPVLPRRVAVVDPRPLLQRPVVHWSYWNNEGILYDRFATGSWGRAAVAGRPPEPLHPFVLRLVESSDVAAHVAALLDRASVEWLTTAARSISRRGDGLYEIVTDAGVVHARWVFDSVCEIPPTFPSPGGPRAVLGGTGIRVVADRPVFSADTATLFDPLDERSFAYLLPLSPSEALVESALFGPAAPGEDPETLLRYLRGRYPEARFTATHVESGSIPLGFAPRRTAGPEHVLIGTKRGLVKASAGYGVVRIAEESKRLAWLWKEHRAIPPVRKPSWHWRLLDEGFLKIAAQDPRRPLSLLSRVMHRVPLTRALRFIDEGLSPQELAPVLGAALPAILRAP